MALIDLYKTSTKQHVAEARTIPGQEVNFFDLQKGVQGPFRTDEKTGDPTQFTTKAQNEFDTELNNLTTPAGFDPKFPLHQWSPTHPFFSPGQPKG